MPLVCFKFFHTSLLCQLFYTRLWWKMFPVHSRGPCHFMFLLVISRWNSVGRDFARLYCSPHFSWQQDSEGMTQLMASLGGKRPFRGVCPCWSRSLGMFIAPCWAAASPCFYTVPDFMVFIAFSCGTSLWQPRSLIWASWLSLFFS